MDLTNHIISFDDLGGVWKLDQDVTITGDDVPVFRSMGDYQVAAGDVFNKGVVFTFDVTKAPSFSKAAHEIKPDTDEFAMLMDVRGIYYRRNTSKLLPSYFYNNELDEYTYWMHYYSFKSISPFYNKVCVEVAK